MYDVAKAKTVMKIGERLGLNPEDLRKLHAAINQIDHQRFLLTSGGITLAISAVGLWLSRVSPNGPEIRMAFILSIALQVLLFVVYFYSFLLKKLLRDFTTYLRLRGASEWEEDRKKFREIMGQKSEWHDDGVSLVFLVLGSFVEVFPWLVKGFYSTDYPARGWIIFYVVVSILYWVMVFGMSRAGWFERESRAESDWKSVFARQDADRGEIFGPSVSLYLNRTSDETES